MYYNKNSGSAGWNVCAVGKEMTFVLRFILVIIILPLFLMSAAAETPAAEPTPLPRAEVGTLTAGTLEASSLLDSALSLLDEDNFFLFRYNEITGSDIHAVFPLGVPYLWGGAYSQTMFSRAPDWYPTRICYSSSEFFEEGRVYLGGFDCIGYIRWIWLDNHLGKIPSLNELLDDKTRLLRQSLYSSSEQMVNPAPDWETLGKTLTPGALFVNRKEGGGRHIMMYIGTPRMWGFTPESVLGSCLDDLLMIHCGLSPVYGTRMQQYIDAHPDQYGVCHTTDGGVAVSLLGPEKSAAPFHAHVQQTDYDFFILNGTVMTLYSTDAVIRSCWYPAIRFD